MKMSVNRDSLFLTELVLDLFIFIICAVVCCGLLVRADSIAKQSAELTDAVYIAESLAERASAGQALNTEYSFNPDGTESVEGGKYTAKCTDNGDTVVIEIFARKDAPVFVLEAAAPEVAR